MTEENVPRVRRVLSPAEEACPTDPGSRVSQDSPPGGSPTTGAIRETPMRARVTSVRWIRSVIMLLLLEGVCTGVTRVTALGGQEEDAGLWTPVHSEKIAPWLRNGLRLGGSTEMMVVMDASPDLTPAQGLAHRADKGRFVYETRRAAALRSQQPLVDKLESQGHEVTRFWV